MSEALIGTNKYPAEVEVANGELVILGDIVGLAFDNFEGEVADWNALSEEDRDVLIDAIVAELGGEVVEAGTVSGEEDTTPAAEEVEASEETDAEATPVETEEPAGEDATESGDDEAAATEAEGDDEEVEVEADEEAAEAEELPRPLQELREVLDRYLRTMGPASPQKADTGRYEQRGLWRAYCIALDMPTEHFHAGMTMLLTTVRENLKGAFRPNLLNRYANQLPMAKDDVSAFLALNRLFTQACAANPEERALRMKSVDLSVVAERLDDVKRQERLLSFFAE